MKFFARNKFLTFRTLYIRMKTSEIKTVDFTSGGYFKVSVVKISARPDEVKGRLYVAQFDALHEKPVLRKTQNKLQNYVFTTKKV